MGTRDGHPYIESYNFAHMQAAKVAERLYGYCVNQKGYGTGYSLGITLIALPSTPSGPEPPNFTNPFCGLGHGQLLVLLGDHMVAVHPALGYPRYAYRAAGLKLERASKLETMLFENAYVWFIEGANDKALEVMPPWLRRSQLSPTSRQAFISFPVNAPFRYREIEVLKTLAKGPSQSSEVVNKGWRDDRDVTQSLERLLARGFIRCVDQQPFRETYCLTTEGLVALNQLQDRDEAAAIVGTGQPPATP